MTNLKRASSKLVFLIYVVLLIIPCSQVFAARPYGLILDQEQEPANITIQIFSNEPIGQSFIPTLSPLAAVEVYISTMNPGWGDDTIACRIRDSTIDGTILGTAYQFLTDAGAPPPVGLGFEG